MVKFYLFIELKPLPNVKNIKVKKFAVTLEINNFSCSTDLFGTLVSNFEIFHSEEFKCFPSLLT